MPLLLDALAFLLIVAQEGEISERHLEGEQQEEAKEAPATVEVIEAATDGELEAIAPAKEPAVTVHVTEEDKENDNSINKNNDGSMKTKDEKKTTKSRRPSSSRVEKTSSTKAKQPLRSQTARRMKS